MTRNDALQALTLILDSLTSGLIDTPHNETLLHTGALLLDGVIENDLSVLAEVEGYVAQIKRLSAK